MIIKLIFNYRIDADRLSDDQFLRERRILSTPCATVKEFISFPIANNLIIFLKTVVVNMSDTYELRMKIS